MSFVKFRPIKDRVQFERIPHPAPKKGAIIIPRAPSEECRVLAVGPKCLVVKAGDRVIIPLQVAGITVPDVQGKICEESQVVAILL